MPQVLSVLVRRGADFATAEDAVQEALIRALATWGRRSRRRDPIGWLVTVAWRRVPRHGPRPTPLERDREVRVDADPPAGAVPATDDTLHLYFLCAHPDADARRRRSRSPSAPSAGSRTRQIAQAYLVPEATMAQRISRAKRTGQPVPASTAPATCGTVMRVLYLVFNEGYSGDVDLAAEAIRLTRQLAALFDDPEVLPAARADAAPPRPPPQPHPRRRQHRAARRAGPQPSGTPALIAEGVGSLQAALARDRLGEYQAQAAIAALHADAPRVEETDWVQIVEWYDELLRFADTPIVRLEPRVAVGEADGAPAGLAALAEVDNDVRGGMRSPRTCTRERRSRSRRPATTPTRRAPHRTPPSATTRRVQASAPQPAARASADDRRPPADPRRDLEQVAPKQSSHTMRMSGALLLGDRAPPSGPWR